MIRNPQIVDAVLGAALFAVVFILIVYLSG